MNRRQSVIDLIMMNNSGYEAMMVLENSGGIPTNNPKFSFIEIRSKQVQ